MDIASTVTQNYTFEFMNRRRMRCVSIIYFQEHMSVDVTFSPGYTFSEIARQRFALTFSYGVLV